jgi:hypothetical protein
VHTGLFPCLAPQRVGPLYEETLAGLGRADRGPWQPRAIHDTTVDTVLKKWAADGALTFATSDPCRTAAVHTPG